MNNTEYTVVGLDGREYSNVNFETIKEWYENRLLNENSLVYASQTGQWKMLKNVFDVSEFNAGRNAQFQQNFYQQPANEPPPVYNQHYQPNTDQHFSPPKPASAKKKSSGIIGLVFLIIFGLGGLNSYFTDRAKSDGAGREKALEILKTYEIPGNDFVDEKSGAKAVLPKGWRKINQDNPVIYISNRKEDEAEMKRMNLSGSAVLATDRAANSVLLLEVINFPNSIDKAKFFDQSANFVEKEIIAQSKPSTYKKISEFSTILANGLAKKIIFEKVSNIVNPNAKDLGLVDTNKTIKGQILVMANSRNAFVFQMWTEKSMYDSAVQDFNFLETNFSMPKD